MSPYALWLLAAVIFLAAEAVGVTGIGLLFAGFGALTVALWIAMVPDTNHITQFVIFFLATSAWAALLWRPLKQFRLSPGKGYSNMVGEVAYVSGHGLKKGEVGEASWSGTIMRATLSNDSAVDFLATGEAAIIAGVEGNTLIVRPKPAA